MFRSVPVRGGELSVEVLPADTDPVLAIHGVSSNCRLWNLFRAEAPKISLVAPDLRGRARSVAVAGPSSPAQHAEDMVAVLDELGLDRVTACGMSMGGFVAVALATAHPGSDSGSHFGSWALRSVDEICTLVRFRPPKRTSVQISLLRRHEPSTSQHTAVSG